MQKTILLYIIKAGAIVSLFTPLVVNQNFVFPFVFPKTAAFQIVVEIMLFAWLVLIFDNPELRPKRSKILWALGIFLFVVFLASALGVDFAHSFWSNYERMTGFVTLLHYFFYFLILSSVLKTKKDWFLFFDFFIIVSLMLSLFSLGQKFNLDGFLLAGQGRVSATFGNPAYFAAYLLFALFVTAFMFFQRQGRGLKIYYTAAFLFNFLILYWAATRGALLAFAASLLLFFLLMLFWPKGSGAPESVILFRRRMRLISLVCLVALILFGSLVYLSRNSPWIKKSPTLLRLATISMQETTSQTRLLAWKSSFNGFKEKPVLGWGWENYNVVFNKHFDPKMFPTENWFDRAHNIVFDTLVTTGVLGLLSYLAIFGAIFLSLLRALKNKRIDFFNAALFAVLPVAYFIQNLFVFDMLHSYLPFFAALAFLNWLDKGANPASGKHLPARSISPNIALKVIIAVVLILVVYFINIKPGLAGYRTIQGMERQNEGVAKLQENFKKALSYGTFGRFEVRLQLFETTRNILSSYQDFQDKESVNEFAKFALDEGDKTIAERPLDARYVLLVGQLNLMYSMVEPVRLDRAAEIFQKAYELNPTKQPVLYSLGEVKLRQGKTEEGISDFKKAIELNDQVFDSHWNMALVYFSLGDLANGKVKIAEMEQKFWPLNGTQYRRIADILALQKNYNEAIVFCQKAIEAEPQNADLYVSLAVLYKNAGDKEKAREAILMAAEINPELKESANKFIETLDTQ
ncbi:MAG: O-antigen ligase family protein [Candidatus Portnoybacteria bacterium]|nr:O-antigen ligase family protein [Candidatus Portnoybacteria bacterium]